MSFGGKLVPAFEIKNDKGEGKKEGTTIKVVREQHSESNLESPRVYSCQGSVDTCQLVFVPILFILLPG